jgi:hypothetical protein
MRLTVPTFGKLVTRWCADVGLVGDYSNHTLRKTSAYQQGPRQASASSR